MTGCLLVLASAAVRPLEALERTMEYSERRSELLRSIRRRNLLRMERRRNPRKACFVYVDYVVRGRSYNDAINNISQGGACIRTQRSLHPGDKIELEFPLLGLRAHIEGRIAWTGPRGIGIEFMSVFAQAKGVRYEFDFGGEDLIYREKEVSEMGKVRKRTVRWEPSADAKKYRLYWSTRGPVGYESDFVELENKTQVILPDEVSSFPRIAGEIELGISAVNAVGSESDITKVMVYVDLTVPEAPKLLTVED